VSNLVPFFEKARTEPALRERLKTLSWLPEAEQIRALAELSREVGMPVAETELRQAYSINLPAKMQSHVDAGSGSQREK
jgi:hypothetical protein